MEQHLDFGSSEGGHNRGVGRLAGCRVESGDSYRMPLQSVSTNFYKKFQIIGHIKSYGVCIKYY